VGLTDSSGNLVGTERYQYDPFGNLLTNPVSPTLQSTIWRYAGGQFDSGTGLTKFGVRYDDPSVGRWTQRDPVGGSLFDPRSSNRYVYAKSDPVNVVDPGGKFNLTPGCILAIIAGIGGIIGALQSAGAEIQGVNGLGLFLGIFSPPLGLIVIIIGNLIALVYASAVIAGIYSGVAAACGCLESHKPHF